jgi:integrase
MGKQVRASVRSEFPKVYVQIHRRKVTATGKTIETSYYMVDPRSAGMRRESFGSKDAALERAREIAVLVKKFGSQPDVEHIVKKDADRYVKLCHRLEKFGKLPEDAVTHYIAHLGEQATRQLMPPLSTLVDKWRDEKLKSKIKPIGVRMQTELKYYARWMKTKWNELKVDEVTHQMVEDELNKLPVGNRNTRRKYLRLIRMFFLWAKYKHHLQSGNPTDGIKIKSEDFKGAFYAPEDVAKILRYVATKEKDLMGMYALQAFAGLRPTESARLQWEDIGFETHEIYVRKGKKIERRFILEGAARDVLFQWLQWYKDRSLDGSKFVRKTNLSNRERKIHKVTMNGGWIHDGFRHGFATNYNALTQDPYKVCHVIGDEIKTVKAHYMRAVTKKDCDLFWSLTPEVVLKEEAQKT